MIMIVVSQCTASEVSLASWEATLFLTVSLSMETPKIQKFREP
jgi:hypothetical protein